MWRVPRPGYNNAVLAPVAPRSEVTSAYRPASVQAEPRVVLFFFKAGGGLLGPPHPVAYEELGGFHDRHLLGFLTPDDDCGRSHAQRHPGFVGHHHYGLPGLPQGDHLVQAGLAKRTGAHRRGVVKDDHGDWGVSCHAERDLVADLLAEILDRPVKQAIDHRGAGHRLHHLVDLRVPQPVDPREHADGLFDAELSHPTRLRRREQQDTGCARHLALVDREQTRPGAGGRIGSHWIAADHDQRLPRPDLGVEFAEYPVGLPVVGSHHARDTFDDLSFLAQPGAFHAGVRERGQGVHTVRRMFTPRPNNRTSPVTRMMRITPKDNA